VPLSRDFEIQQTEVTQREWLETGWDLPEAPPAEELSHCAENECPIDWTTWFWALRYANWMSEQHGLKPCFVLSGCKDTAEPSRDFSCESVTLQATTIYDCDGYRLPTSAEWEYAARAGTITEFYSGAMELDFHDNSDCNLDPNLSRVGWYCANVPDARTPSQREQPVGLLPPNGWGLHDVLGNVGEWVMDTGLGLGWEDPYPDPEGQFEFLGPGTVRGCHFFQPAAPCRVAQKLPFGRADRWGGFRLARTLGPGKPPTLADVPSVGQAR
jgi:formylglycine-generating enzyme